MVKWLNKVTKFSELLFSRIPLRVSFGSLPSYKKISLLHKNQPLSFIGPTWKPVMDVIWLALLILKNAFIYLMLNHDGTFVCRIERVCVHAYTSFFPLCIGESHSLHFQNLILLRAWVKSKTKFVVHDLFILLCLQ